MRKLFKVIMIVLSLTVSSAAYAWDSYSSLGQDYGSDEGSSTEGFLMSSYNMNFGEKQQGQSNWGLSFLLSFDDHFNRWIYWGSGLGYIYGNSTFKMDSFKSSTNSHILEIPLYVGVAPVKGLKLNTGPCFDWTIAGNIKEFSDGKEVGKTNFKDLENLKRFSAGWRFTMRISALTVSLRLGFGKNENASMSIGLTL